MKRYKVVDRKRFICFLMLVLIAVSFTVLGFVNHSSANETTDHRYTEIIIEKGDTLWEIAKVYGSSEKDIREVIYDICRFNNIKASDLRPGQILYIPEE